MLSLSTVLNMGWKSDATWKIRNIFENCSASLESSWLFYVLHCTLSRPAFALFKMSVLPRHLLTLELCQLDSLKLWVLGNWAPCDSAAVRRPRSASKWCIYRKVWCHFTSNGVPTADRQGEIRQAESHDRLLTSQVETSLWKYLISRKHLDIFVVMRTYSCGSGS